MLIRKWFKIFWLTLVVIFSLCFATALVIQLPAVQTFVVKAVTSFLEDKLDGDIQVEKVHLYPFRTLLVKNILIIDRNPAEDPTDSTAVPVDTFFRAEYLTAKFSLPGLLHPESIHIDEVRLSNAQFNFVLEEEQDLPNGDTSMDNLSRIFQLKSSDPNRQIDTSELFFINDVIVENLGFHMRNYSSVKVPYYGGICWDDLDIRRVNAKASDLRFKAEIMTGVAEHFDFEEKSGYSVRHAEGTVRVGQGLTLIENMKFEDPWSEVYLPFFSMKYKNIYAFPDFMNAVYMEAEAENSIIDFNTIAYFAPDIEYCDLRGSFSGGFSGYVSDFRVRDFQMSMENGLFEAVVNGRMTGVPDVDKMWVDAKTENARISADGLGKFLSEWTPDESVIDFSQIAPGQVFKVNASCIGLLNSMQIDADINSDIGDIYGDILMTDAAAIGKPIGFKGTLSTDELDLGKVLSTDLLGPTSLRTSAEATIGDRFNAKIDSLFVKKLRFNEYDYSGLMAVGFLSDDMFNGTIIASDPNLNFLLQGGFALSSKTNNAKYQFYANISDADLYALNIDKRGKSKLRFQTMADFTKAASGNILGNITVENLVFENKDSINHIGNINLASYSEKNLYKMQLKSNFADGSYSGTAPVTEFINDVQNITLKKEASALFPNADYNWSGNSYNFSLKTHNLMSLMAFLMPGAYIEANTEITVDVDSVGLIDATLDSKRLAIGPNFLKGIKLSANNHNDFFSGDFTADELQFAGRSILNNQLKFHTNDNFVGASYSYDNQSDSENSGEVVMNADLSRENEMLNVALSLLPSSVNLNSKKWNIQPASIKLLGTSMVIDSLEFTCGDEKISLQGRTSKADEDTLTLQLDRFDLAILEPILGKELQPRGLASGYVKLTSPTTPGGLLADIVCDSTFIAGEALGNVYISSFWEQEFSRFDIRLSNEYNGINNINARAKLTPKTQMLDGYIGLDRLSIKYAEPFMTDVFCDMKGHISGDIWITGPLTEFKIRSENTRLSDASMKVEYTNVPYFAEGEFSINEKGAYFDDVRIWDRFDGSGTVHGAIYWDRFDDIFFDTYLKVKNIEGINLTKQQSQDFYGNIFGTGNVSITGPLEKMEMSLEAVTSKTGQLHIPMYTATTAGGTTNLLTFKEDRSKIYVDPYEVLMAKWEKAKVITGDILFKMRVEANPSVEAFIELDPTSGNMLSGRGNGLIEMEIGTDVFNMNGDFNITNGMFKFSALGLVSRDFAINEGSSINFNGDIMQSILDIDASYITKASLSTLLADESTGSNRRTVECGIHITDKLTNPRLDFSINVPDLNPMVKSRVESALSTEDKVQKQFISLLLTNSFLPDEQSGIVNNGSLLYSNVTEAMANQLSNILHKLDIPLDLGLQYQQTESGTNIFDVAVSTQLFNNRVIVNGNIGNKEYSSAGSANVVGDIDIEIKLNKSGSLRLTVFSHSADLYSNYLDNSQRNGVGIMYQNEFNSLEEFFKNLFLSRERKEEERMNEQEELLYGEKVKMTISGKKDEGRKQRKTTSDSGSSRGE